MNSVVQQKFYQPNSTNYVPQKPEKTQGESNSNRQGNIGQRIKGKQLSIDIQDQSMDGKVLPQSRNEPIASKNRTGNAYIKEGNRVIDRDVEKIKSMFRQTMASFMKSQEDPLKNEEVQRSTVEITKPPQQQFQKLSAQLLPPRHRQQKKPSSRMKVRKNGDHTTTLNLDQDPSCRPLSAESNESLQYVMGKRTSYSRLEQLKTSVIDQCEVKPRKDDDLGAVIQDIGTTSQNQQKLFYATATHNQFPLVRKENNPDVLQKVSILSNTANEKGPQSQSRYMSIIEDPSNYQLFPISQKYIWFQQQSSGRETQENDKRHKSPDKILPPTIDKNSNLKTSILRTSLKTLSLMPKYKEFTANNGVQRQSIFNLRSKSNTEEGASIIKRVLLAPKDVNLPHLNTKNSPITSIQSPLNASCGPRKIDFKQLPEGPSIVQQFDKRRIQKLAKMKRLKLQPLQQILPDTLSNAVSKAAEALQIDEDSTEIAKDDDDILDVIERHQSNRIVNKKHQNRNGDPFIEMRHNFMIQQEEGVSRPNSPQFNKFSKIAPSQLASSDGGDNLSVLNDKTKQQAYLSVLYGIPPPLILEDCEDLQVARIQPLTCPAKIEQQLVRVAKCKKFNFDNKRVTFYKEDEKQVVDIEEESEIENDQLDQLKISKKVRQFGNPQDHDVDVTSDDESIQSIGFLFKRKREQMGYQLDNDIQNCEKFPTISQYLSNLTICFVRNFSSQSGHILLKIKFHQQSSKIVSNQLAKQEAIQKQNDDRTDGIRNSSEERIRELRANLNNPMVAKTALAVHNKDGGLAKLGGQVKKFRFVSRKQKQAEIDIQSKFAMPTIE